MFLVHDPFVRKNRPTGVGRLSALLQPWPMAWSKLSVIVAGLDIGIIRPNILNEFTITWRPAVGNDNVVERHNPFYRRRANLIFTGIL